MDVGVIILAAGKGTRMKTGLAKVLHEAAGRTLLGWAVESLSGLGDVQLSIVVGHQAEEVRAQCPDDASVVVQEPQNGTGHATSVGMAGLAAHDGAILVMPGDMPLIRAESLSRLLDDHKASGAAATILTVDLDDPTGYGRVIRAGGAVASIVEERDTTDEQKAVTEVNTSVYVFDGPLLAEALGRIGTDNDQGEYYLTDVIGILVGDGHAVGTTMVASEEGTGINTQGQLAEVAATLRARINESLLEAGVWMLDPSRVYIDATATVEPGARIHPDTYIRGTSSVAAGAEVGPSVQLTNTSVASDARVQQCVAIEATVGKGAMVGPFAYLRPGAVLEEGAKVGTYVEVKGSSIGAGSKVPHLSYIGDATIGEGSNIGAGTITVNYDGYDKHRTTIGNNVRIGSDTMLVAPVSIGDNAFTGAGSVVTNDVPEGALAVERTHQKNIDGYADKRRERANGEQ